MRVKMMICVPTPDPLSPFLHPARLRLLASQQMKVLAEDRDSARMSSSARQAHAALEIRTFVHRREE
jgi:hypothetical protein